MSTHTAVVNDEQRLTPEQALVTDQIGNEVYASHYAERKAYRLILTCGTVVLCGSMWLNWSLAHRPVVNPLRPYRRDAPCPGHPVQRP